MQPSPLPSPPPVPPAFQLLFDEFERYPFSDDEDFRAGLPTVIAAIRGQDCSPRQVDEMIGRAQWFYFTRLRGITIPWEMYVERNNSTPISPRDSPGTGRVSTNTDTGASSVVVASRSSSPRDRLASLNHLAEARRMMAETGNDVRGQGMSFSLLCQLISEGRAAEVDTGIVVPDGINDTPPSCSELPIRPKPWESATLSSTAAGTALAPTPVSFDWSPQPGSVGPSATESESPTPADPTHSFYHSLGIDPTTFYEDSLQPEQPRSSPHP